MASAWDFVKSFTDKFSALKAFFVILIFLAGLAFNAIYTVVDWIQIPFNSQKDIIILQERTEEFSKVLGQQQGLRDEVNLMKNSQDELNKRMKALEDGQLRLFIQIERLDERTLQMQSQRKK